MQFSTIIILILFFISLILNYQSISNKKTAFQIVNEMGLGYNLANSFDSYNSSKKVTKPDEQITLYGNPIPTKKMISNIKKNGFKTIRFPVTWINFIDDLGNIDSEWMLRVKQVVKWIIDKNIYCILNIYKDSEEGNWLYDIINTKNKYIKLWAQIAEEFKDYNEYLIFELMNKPILYHRYDIDKYEVLNNLNQEFINIIRNSGGFNEKRLLAIPGMDGQLDYTKNLRYKIPKDPANKIALSINYYYPMVFTYNSKTLIDHNDIWGEESEYEFLFINLNIIKENFLDNGIPVIITEVGVETNGEKEISSIREYLYVVLSLSYSTNGIMACLMDTSNIKYGNMNYYNRETNEWYDKKFENIISQITKGEFVHTSDFYYISNIEVSTTPTEFGDFSILLNSRKPLKVFLNALTFGELFEDYDFSVSSFDKEGNFFDISFGKENGKKQYDGTTIFTFDVSDYDCNLCIQFVKWYPDELILNNEKIEFNESFANFDYKGYKSRIYQEIN